LYPSKNQSLKMFNRIGNNQLKGYTVARICYLSCFGIERECLNTNK
jgi:hypothetical protein